MYRGCKSKCGTVKKENTCDTRIIYYTYKSILHIHVITSTVSFHCFLTGSLFSVFHYCLKIYLLSLCVKLPAMVKLPAKVTLPVKHLFLYSITIIVIMCNYD